MRKFSWRVYLYYWVLIPRRKEFRFILSRGNYFGPCVLNCRMIISFYFYGSLFFKKMRNIVASTVLAPRVAFYSDVYAASTTPVAQGSD